MPNREQEVRDMAMTLRDEAVAVVVTTDATFEKAGEMLKRIKDVRTQINAVFDPIINAAHKAHKVALDQKKAVDQFYVEADRHLRSQVAEYNRMKQEERGRAALALAASGEMTLPAEAPKVEGISFQKRWAFEVNDPDALPREYTIPDDAKIRKVVNALGSNANIPGVRIWQIEAPVVK